MLGGRWRHGLAGVALVGHMLTTLGFPIPALPPDKRGGGQPFPCQDRPCGCLTAEGCWAGDCCCSTLEEKLEWAEANGVEPPPHVRPLVRARQHQQAPPKKKKSCCSAPGPGEPAVSEGPTPSCCSKGTHTSPSAACDVDPSGETGHTGARHDDPAAACCTKAPPSHSGSDPPQSAPSSVRWVAGVFAQKCRGEGPAGLFQLDPVVVTDLAPPQLDRPERARHPAPRSDRVPPTSQCPPTPPPRPF
ncbi:hypothetical protein FTUN_7457 [Frigoriglobus tundricola]|uniref:Uncharacterized protein n=1 Tax=Frigoriglobus tundricola TaxID=2774151 RepID=A0A6M5Z230_9BACT|nr:hypothetical protein FTUN_7457 [Frigoriglobus tundricola]